jgi:hypothetical protein
VPPLPCRAHRRRAPRRPPPRRHPGRSRSEAEAQTRDPFRARRQAGAWAGVIGSARSRRGRASASLSGVIGAARARAIAEWVPDTPASAALGDRSGMTRRPCGMPGPQGGATRRGQPRRLCGPSPRASLLGVIPGEAGAKRRRRPGTHSAPVGRTRARAGVIGSARSWRGRASASSESCGRGRRRGMGSGYARLRCARRAFRNDAAAVRHAGPPEVASRFGASPRGATVRRRAPRRPAASAASSTSAASERFPGCHQRSAGPPLLGVIPGEAGAKRRRRPGTHSAPGGRTRARAGVIGSARSRRGRASASSESCGRGPSRNGFRIRSPPLRSAGVPE